MKKIYTYILAYIAAMMLFTACSDDDVIMEQGGASPINFSLSAANQTRTDGVTLDTYVNDFRVLCENGSAAANGTFVPNDIVMDNFVVWYEEKDASNTSASNTNNWEYVGNSHVDQSIKYWDTNQPYHIFYAVANADVVEKINYDATSKLATSVSFTLNASSNPMSMFYADPVVVSQASYGSPVRIDFKSFYSKIRVGFYETIPGYVVKDVTFYDADDNKSGTVTLLGSFATQGSATITYTNNVTSPAATLECSPSSTENKLALNGLNYNKSVQENLLAAGSYLNLSSTAPTYASEAYILPVSKAKPITIKCDYKLVANDHKLATDCEEIEVKGATATVPSDYCIWAANRVYTYIFKISENSNGQTGETTDPAGLYPITFDATVSSVEENTKSDYTIRPTE